MKECAAFLLAVVLFIGAVVYVINELERRGCVTQWADSPYPYTRYDITAGCRVSKDGIVFIPSTAVREFQ